MAVWPFRRKSRRKRPRSGNQSDGDLSGREAETPEDARARKRRTEPPPRTLPTASASVKRQPNKLHRRRRSYSFEKGTEDALAVEPKGSSRKRITGAASQGPVDPRAHPYSKDSGLAHPAASSLFDHTFPRMPTLHNKRHGEHLPHKKSSKRRKADHAREAEIKAMSSSYDPSRPAAEPWSAGRPMRKDTKHRARGLGLSFRRSWDRDQEPDSDISLPLPGSIHSSLSSDSEHVSFKLSALEALAPRPTLRYAVCPRYSPPPTDRPDRHVSVRNRLYNQQPIPEATLRAHKRIDDLADDLTAGDLRELMERDERRRARKRERDQERIERRLARRAEKHRAAEREGRHSPPNLERGVLGRESAGLGTEPESTVVTSSRQRKSSSPTSKQLGKRPAADMEDDHEPAGPGSQRPLEHFHRTDSVPLDDVSFVSAPEEPSVPRASSPRKRIMLMPKRSGSKSPQPSELPKTDASESTRKVSDGSSKRARRSWSNLFRWGSRKRRDSPSSFANTSRDSMANQPVPSAGIPDALTRKLSSNVPKRTMSRFREDLPELPLSPPESRQATPDADPRHPAIIEQDSPELNNTTTEDLGTPKRRDTPMSPEELGSMPTTVDPSPEPVTVDVGTIDSEGAWFGKKTGSRRSPPMTMTPPHFSHRRGDSASTFDSHHDPDLPQEMIVDDVSYDANDEYPSQLDNQRSSGSHFDNGRPDSAVSDASDDARWGSVGGRHPNVVEPQEGNFVKSREGLLNVFDADEDNLSGVESHSVANGKAKANGRPT